MSAHFDRAALLFDQERFDLAEQELRRALGEEPNHPAAHALLAMCLSRRQQHEEAVAVAGQAVGLAPDLPFAHFARAEALFRADRNAEAEEAIAEALDLDPSDADAHGLLAGIRFDRRDWAGALTAAEEGLAFNPEHDNCTNVRAMALVKLGRNDEAGAALAGALERNPDSAFSHASQGWTLLHQRQPDRALEHFREALRLDPELGHARAGMVEALKARHLVYRVMLSFFLWMGRLSAKAQWGMILGVLIGQQMLARLEAANPALAPITTPLLYGLFGFVLLTWTADSLFDLVLRLSRDGRRALTRDQIVASNWLGACLLVTLAVLAAGLTVGPDTLVYATIPCLILSAATAGVFRAAKGGPRWLLAACVVGLAILAVRVNYLFWLIDHRLDARLAGVVLPDARAALTYFLGGVFLYFLLANAVAAARPHRWSAD